jgi:hypothetical protein
VARKKPASDKKPTTSVATDPDELRGKERTTKVKPLGGAFQPAPQEQPARDLGQKDRSRLRVSVSEKGGVPQVNADILLMEAIGTNDLDFMNGVVRQLAHVVGRGGKIDEGELSFILSMVKGVQPRDEVEAMLAVQMAAVHIATMRSARQLADVENIPQQDSAERVFNKLARTYVTQMEALKRYRTGGEQKVTVQHVSVSEGGQAIVGHVTQAAHQTGRDKAAASPPALTHSQTPAMPIVGEPASATVPLKREPHK